MPTQENPLWDESFYNERKYNWFQPAPGKNPKTHPHILVNQPVQGLVGSIQAQPNNDRRHSQWKPFFGWLPIEWVPFASD